MKRNLRFYVTLLLMVVASVGSFVRAASKTGTITFGTNAVRINAASVTGNDDLGNTWSITTAGTTSFTTNAGYYQVGSSSKPATSITFTTTLPESVEISSMSAKFGGFSGTAGTITLKVGDTEVGTGSLNATNDVTVNSTSTATGTVLTVTVTGISKGVKCYNISYTYEEEGGSTTESPLTSIALSGDYPTTFYQNDAFSYAGAVVTATYEDNSTKDVTSSATFSTPDMTTTGTKEVTVSYTEGEVTKTTSYNITVNEYVQPTAFDINLNNTLFGTNHTGSVSVTDANPVTGTLNQVTVTYAGSGSHYINDSQIRFYSGNKLTFEAPAGYNITEIVFTADGTWTATIGATPGTYYTNTKTWTGNASSVLFEGSGSGQCRMSKASIKLADASIPVKTNPELAFSAATATANLGETFTAPTLSNQYSVAVSYSSSDPTVATVDENTGAVTLVAVGTTTITATFAGDDTYEADEASYTLTVVDPNAKGQVNNPYTVAEALAFIETLGTATSGDVYVSGIISQVKSYSSQYNSITYYIYDAAGGDELQVYSGKNLNNTDFTSQEDLQVGDEVTVFGKLKLYNNSTKEFDSGNYLTAFNRPNPKAEAGLSFPEASYQATVGETFTAPTLTNPNNLTVTYTSNNAEVATVDENTGAVTIVAAGTAKITASSAETEDYYAGTASYTLNVKNPPATLVTVDADGNTTFDLTQNDWGFPEGSANKAVEEGSFSNSGYTIKVAGSNSNGYYYNTGYLMIGKAGAYLTLPAFDYDVDKIEVVGRSGASTSVKQNIYVGETAVSTETTGCTVTNTYEIAEDYQAAGNVYTLKLTSAHNTQITSIIVYKKAATPTVVTLTLDEDVDNSAVLTANDGKIANVTLTRTFHNSSYNTIALPFSLSEEQVKATFGEGTHVMAFSATETNSAQNMQLNFVASTTIAAGTPYLILPANETVNPVFEGVTVDGTANNVVTGQSANFVPVVNATEVAASENNVFVGAGNTLYYNNETATMKGFRAYFQITGSVTGKSIGFNFDGVPTGIKTIDVTESHSAEGWFTLDGQKLNTAPTQKGLYIHNGKKVVVK